MAEISKNQQLEVSKYIQETFDMYVELSASRREVLFEIYEAYRTFKSEKSADWSTAFKVNKAHEVVNKVLPRIIAKNPRWLVSARTDEFIAEDRQLTWQERQQRIKEQQNMAEWVQDYLTYIFDRYNLKEPIRLWAKSFLTYGNWYAKVKYKYETTRVRGENGIEEKITWEYPTIDAKSWTDVYVDPRYVLLEDMPCVIEVTENVRFHDLKRKEDKYFNLDIIEGLPTTKEFQEDPNSSKAKIYEITGIPMDNAKNGVDKNSLTLRTFYGKYLLEGEDDEKLYRVSTVNDMIVIEFEEITCIPFEDIKAFDDIETHYAVWMVEPIMGLQDEMNFKKNAASEYINHWLNRSWIWSPNSWINPATLIWRPNNIITTTKDAITAEQNLREIPHRDLNPTYFQEQNDIERQIQSQTFTVDTSANKSNQALTNTATWIRVKFFESNTVIDELRKHFEEWLERLAYKLLESTFENMEDNIVIKKLDDEWFWEINKELLRDAITRYSIKVEVNSSSYDDIESRRENEIAFFNILSQAAQAGVPINFKESVTDVIGTFEKKDPSRFIFSDEELAEQQSAAQIEQPEKENIDAVSLTEEVAKWGITTWVQ